MSKDVGCVTVYKGPMFSGKSTRLAGDVGALKCSARKRYRIAVIKADFDNRYQSKDDAPALVTHQGQKLAATHVCGRTLRKLVPALLADYDVAVIDDGHFFADIAEACGDLAAAGKLVFVATLAVDFKMRVFPNVAAIVADKEIHLRAKCHYCGKSAPFNVKIGGDRGKVLEVGGQDMYKSVCRACYGEHSLDA